MTSNARRLSVVISAYNAERYILETLESVLSQDYPNFEVIVVDDCSTDGTANVVRSVAAPNLRYERLPENSGCAARPRNVGIGLASGEIVVTLDADDIATPGSLSARARLLETQPDLGLVFCDGTKFHVDRGLESKTYLEQLRHFQKIPKIPVGPGAWRIRAEDAYDGLAVGNFIAPSGVMFPKNVVSEVGLFDDSLGNGDDVDFYFRVTRRFDIGFASSNGFLYRLHENNISKRAGNLGFSRIRVLEKQLKLEMKASTRRAMHRVLAELHFDLGYTEQVIGNFRHARASYRTSLANAFYWPSLKGYLVTYMGPTLYRRLLSLRSKPSL